MIAATALLAAACGSSSTTLDVGAGAAPAEGSQSASESDDTAAPSTESTEGESSEPSSAEAAPVTNLFPDIEVVNVADASTFNLAAELGGGELPVLLWFWAPH